jgi:hypothetical protein
MPARTIDEVLDQLDTIIAISKREAHVGGYFAALYRRVTAGVKTGIAEGRFEDGARMEQLDVCFANRYIEAWEQHRRGDSPTTAWLYAFRIADAKRGLILQHLLLGMNAHINLDLAIAAAQTAPGVAYPKMERDFMAINALLGALFDDTEYALTQAFPPLRLIRLLNRKPMAEAVSNFSITKARQAAWEAGKQLSVLPAPQQLAEINALDQRTTTLAGMIYNGAYDLTTLYKTIRLAEKAEVAAVIELIETATAP